MTALELVLHLLERVDAAQGEYPGSLLPIADQVRGIFYDQEVTCWEAGL